MTFEQAAACATARPSPWPASEMQTSVRGDASSSTARRARSAPLPCSSPGTPARARYRRLQHEKLGDKRVRLGITKYSKDDVLLLQQLVEAGEYQAVIDGTYPLEDVVEATRYVETGQKTGNVVLTVSTP